MVYLISFSTSHTRPPVIFNAMFDVGPADFTDIFRNTVVDDFTNEYLAGRTPNPCVRCNSFVKWDTFIDQANQLGAKYIATGHYANIHEENGSFFLTKGTDALKDQSYVL